MPAYVILSRVTKADGLLLLRAFNPDLFRMGAAPGPHCLLKLLRARFKQTQTPGAAQDSNEEYDLAAATAEYNQRVCDHESERRKRKQFNKLSNNWENTQNSQNTRTQKHDKSG